MRRSRANLSRIIPILNSWSTVTPPVGWTWTLPFTMQKSGRNIRVDPSWNLRTYANVTVSKTYWVKPSTEGGSDAANGLSEATAFAGIDFALAKADGDRIMVKAGIYGVTAYPVANHWNNLSPARNIEVIGYGGEVISSSEIEFASQVWNAVDSHWELSSTYALTPFDKTVLDVNGDYTILTLVANVAAVDAAPGSYYYDAVADILYVQTFDSREPDVNMIIFIGAANGVMNDGVTYYIEGITFYRYGTAAFLHVPVSGAKLLFKNCVFKYTTGDCFSSSGAPIGSSLIVFQDCLVAHTGNDGIHLETTGTPADLIIINTVSRNNGDPGDTSANGYSRHGPGNTVVINSEMYGSYGPNMRDITNGTLTWMLGCYNHDPAIAAANFSMGDTSILWLDSCKSSGGTIDLQATLAGTTIYYRDLIWGGVTNGLGTFAPY